MIPSFPSDTWPSMTTLSTGLYTESHGIISNYFLDIQTNKIFKYTDKPSDYENNGKFFTKEPIWLTNQKQGGASAVYYFPGYNGFKEKPRYHNSPNISSNDNIETFQNTVDLIMQYIQNDKNLNFILIWIDKPDLTGHEFGKNSLQYKDALESVDRDVVGYVLEKLNSYPEINLILTSDHGFIDIDYKSKLQVKFLDDYLQSGSYQSNWAGGSCFLRPKNGFTIDDLVNNLTSLSQNNFRIYRRDKAFQDIPKYLHYRDNINIPPILILADREWVLEERVNPPGCCSGRHGYDIAYVEMSTIFYARGPAFRKGVTLNAFESVNVVPLIAHLLGIVPQPNNGSLLVFNNVLEINESVNLAQLFILTCLFIVTVYYFKNIFL
ncbi:bis(5'-adenosyl)-triphosphatase enpp4 isoform X2 [Hydra vulgaris]|nr:bis(5'-adenosyl)-triphosphatase enpp4 isoform X2 [Hydra vulgaris]